MCEVFISIYEKASHGKENNLTLLPSWKIACGSKTRADISKWLERGAKRKMTANQTLPPSWTIASHTTQIFLLTGSQHWPHTQDRQDKALCSWSPCYQIPLSFPWSFLSQLPQDWLLLWGASEEQHTHTQASSPHTMSHSTISKTQNERCYARFTPSIYSKAQNEGCHTQNERYYAKFTLSLCSKMQNEGCYTHFLFF